MYTYLILYSYISLILSQFIYIFVDDVCVGFVPIVSVCQRSNQSIPCSRLLTAAIYINCFVRSAAAAALGDLHRHDLMLSNMFLGGQVLGRKMGRKTNALIILSKLGKQSFSPWIRSLW